MYTITNIIFILIILTVIISICIDQFNIRKRKTIEIIKLNRSITDRAFMLRHFVAYFGCSILIFYENQKFYNLLKDFYVSNAFQLFNYDFLESLSGYFRQNNMIREYYYIVAHQGMLLIMKYGIILLIFQSIINLIGLQKSIVYETGILVNNRIITWDKINDFKWSNDYKKKLFGKSEYCNLTIMLSRTHYIISKAKLSVNRNDKEVVNGFLKKYISKASN